MRVSIRKFVLLGVAATVLGFLMGTASQSTYATSPDKPAMVAEVRDAGSRPDPAIPGGADVGGPFTLINQDGKTVTERDFLGRYMLVFFGFSYCPDICPTELQTALDALTLLGNSLAHRVQVVFITIDPARDEPAVLKEYLSQFGDGIVGLTGSADQISAVAKAYKVYYARAHDHDHDNEENGDDSYMMDHSSFLYLMGPDGHFIKVFPSGTGVDDLAAALKKVVKP